MRAKVKNRVFVKLDIRYTDYFPEDMWDDGDGEMGWNNGNRLGKYLQGTATNLRAYHRSDNLDVRLTTDLHGYLGCIWRLCVSYCNLNKITC